MLGIIGLLPIGCDGTPTSETPPQSEPSAVGQLLERVSSTPSVLEFYEVDELRAKHHGSHVRVHGWVKPGTIMQRADPPSIRFELVRGDATLTVKYAGPPPDRFQDRLETIVTGTLSDDGASFQAEDLVAKCPDDYDTLPAWPEHGGPR